MALAEFRKEIAILKACRDVNMVQFVVSTSAGGTECMHVREPCDACPDYIARHDFMA